MENVATIIDRKQPHFKRISPDSSINDALVQMSGRKVEYLIVMDEDENFLGLLTEHDIAKKAIFINRQLAQIKVKEMMNTLLPFADVNDSLKHCMRLMRQFNIRHLPVFENLTFRGIISSDDILEELLHVQEEVFG
jgi:CBS domain-containing protein